MKQNKAGVKMRNNNTVNLSELYKGIQKEMMASLDLSSPIPHSTMKGDATEYDWIYFFSKYLPKRYSVDKGIVIDSEGKRSNQIDIIIYDTHFSHFIFNKSNESFRTLLIPAESVFAVFEVKQKLDTQNLIYASKKAASVRNLIRTSVPVNKIDSQQSKKDLYEIVAGLLTTKSNLVNPDSVIDNLNVSDDSTRLDLVCSIDKFTFSVNKSVDKEGTEKYDVEYCKPEHSLVYLLLSLLEKLQKMGNPPAIDYSKYKSHITTENIPQKIDNE